LDCIDEARFPRVAEYVSSLPQGLASHPSCQAKGAVLRSILGARPLSTVPADGLPTSVLELMARPPSNSQWIPETLFWSVTFAVADCHGLDAKGHIDWHREVNTDLYRSAVFRFLMSLASPELLLDLGSTRWAAMHRGTRITLKPTGKRSTQLTIDFPDRLFSRLVLEGLISAFVVALEFSRAKSPAVTLVEANATSGLFEATWG